MGLLSSYIKIIESGKDLNKEQGYSCLCKIFSGECSDSEIINLLSLFADKGESVSEIVGFATAMREHMIKVPLTSSSIDLCGTGGIGKDRFNVSTAASFVLAAAGVPVAKHGNYGSKKPNGSFNFLEALCMDFNQEVSVVQKLHQETNLCFLFARNYHPAMRYVAAARKKIARRTIFNILGPLCNPASVKHQIIGVTNVETAKKIAAVIQELGVEKALIIAGGDGLDELATTSPSSIFEVTRFSIKETIFDPKNLNLRPVSSGFEGADSETNAKIFNEIISLEKKHKNIADLICLNSAAAMYCFGKVSNIEAGFEVSQALIKFGAVKKAVDLYKDRCKSI